MKNYILMELRQVEKILTQFNSNLIFLHPNYVVWPPAVYSKQ